MDQNLHKIHLQLENYLNYIKIFIIYIILFFM